MQRTKLKEIRKAWKLTQTQVAQRMGCTCTAYFLIESGQHGGKLTQWVKLQNALQIPDKDMWELIKEGLENDTL